MDDLGTTKLVGSLSGRLLAKVARSPIISVELRGMRMREEVEMWRCGDTEA